MSNSSTSPETLGLSFETGEEWAEFLQNFGANGRTMKDLTALTPESMEVFYMVAYNQYNAGHYEESSKVFQLLAALDHFDKRFWMGLGASRSMEGRHEEAIKAYGYLGMLDMRDPVPAFHCSKSFLALGKVPEAEAALRATISNSEGRPEHADLCTQAVNLLEVIQSSQKEAKKIVS